MSPDGSPAALLAMDRLRGFVDGVLAVVITILVLGIEVPDTPLDGSETSKFLHRLGSQLHPYFASFGLVAAYWIQHTVILAYIRHANRAFVWLNIFFLIPLSLQPFLTELRADNPESMVAIVLFAGGQILCGLLLLAAWLYAAANNRFVARTVDPAVIRSMSIRIALGPLLCAAAAFVDSKSPVLGTLMFLGVPMLYMSHRKVDAAWRTSAGDE